MLNRQRALLAFLSTAQANGYRGLSRVQLTKFAFLFRECVGATAGLTYEFVPYKYGPFSFALYRELDSLMQKGLVRETAGTRSLLSVASGSQELARAEADKLPRSAWPSVREVSGKYGTLGHDELLRTVYSQHPWYAQKSERADLISHNPVQRTQTDVAAYTVGYEGKCVDGFLAGLFRKGIVRIVDVRRNAISRKYGFAKSTLSKHMAGLGLEYVHIPELGIASGERADLTDANAYDALLERYERQHLSEKAAHVDQVVELLHEKPSALLCMERDPAMCHRSRLAANAGASGGLEVRHLM